MTCETRLEELGLLCLEKEDRRNRISLAFKYKDGYKKDDNTHFSVVAGDKIRSNGLDRDEPAFSRDQD